MIRQSVRFIFGLDKTNVSSNQPTKQTGDPYEDLFIKLVGVSSEAVGKKSRFVVEGAEEPVHGEPVRGVQDKLDREKLKIRLAEIEREEQEKKQSTDHSSTDQHAENQSNQSFEQTSQQSSQSPPKPTITETPRHAISQQAPQRSKSRIGVPEIIEDPTELDIHAKNPELISRMNQLMAQSGMNDDNHEFLNPAVSDSTNQSELHLINQSTTPAKLKTQYKPSVRTAQVDEVTVKKGSLTQLQLMRVLALTQTINPSTGQKFDSNFLSQKFHVSQNMIDRLMDHVAAPRLFVPDRYIKQPDDTGRIGVWPHRSIYQSSKHEPPPVYSGGKIMGEHLVDHLVRLRR